MAAPVQGRGAKKSLSPQTFGKTCILALLIALGPPARAFDWGLSLGLGTFFTHTYENDQWTIEENTPYENFKSLYGIWGVYGFFDATLVELLIGMGGVHGVYGSDAGQRYEGGGPVLTLGVLGKYPFPLGNTLTFSPVLGVEHQRLLGAVEGNKNAFPESASEEAKDAFMSVWFKFGAAADFDITGRLYFRAAFLYGVKFYSKTEEDFYNANKNAIQYYAFHGPSFRLALGYKLHTFSFSPNAASAAPLP